MKTASILFFYLISIIGFAQTPFIQWQRRYGGSLGDNFIDGIKSKDGGFVYAGCSSSSDGEVGDNNGNADVWIVKADSVGNIQWENNYGGSDVECAEAINQTSDSGYIVVAYTLSNDVDVTGYHGGIDLWVLKIDRLGTLEWQKCLGGTDWDRPGSIQQTNDGGYIVGGSTTSNDGDVNGLHGTLGNFDYWVVKLDSVGNIQWQRCLGSYSPEERCKVLIARDNKYVASGFSSGNNNGDVTCSQHGGGDYWVVKLDTNGSILFQNCFGGSSGDQGYDIALCMDGGFIIAGESNSSDGDVTGIHGVNPFRPDYWIVKTDSLFNLEWENCFGGSDIEVPTSVHQTIDSGYVVTGWTDSNDGNVTGNHSAGFGEDFWTVKLDHFGNLEWQKASGGTANELENAIIQTNDLGFLIIGGTASTDGDLSGIISHGNGDAWVVKLSPTTSNIDMHVNAISDFTANVNNQNLILKFYSQAKQLTNVELFDVTGRLNLSQPFLIEVGFNKREFQVGELNSGVYLIRLTTHTGSINTKLIKE